MAARDRYSRKLECSKCGRTGFAEVSEDDDPRRKTPGFRIDEMPAGFSTERASSDPARHMVRCRCGNVFAFQQKTYYAPGGEPARGR
ncbi:hypothetical protein OCK02_23085 [Rhizobium sp. TRM96647]|uniref:hypothetical protein n=1 Tax=unclassified Rhizobium TaxID=2613769 RepID=UPI0021E85AF1|nr:MULTISPECIES: hypothetical protein [unclassified Rhizobium]MCV3739063.1 hypothetical protein [Rhizobium sp. TRM96647]MCV3760794.1 hypothetical protein [Rhizobium sp. TRM96650]